jgi:hypothetical protein
LCRWARLSSGKRSSSCLITSFVRVGCSLSPKMRPLVVSPENVTTSNVASRHYYMTRPIFTQNPMPKDPLNCPRYVGISDSVQDCVFVTTLPKWLTMCSISGAENPAALSFLLRFGIEGEAWLGSAFVAVTVLSERSPESSADIVTIEQLIVARVSLIHGNLFAGFGSSMKAMSLGF